MERLISPSLCRTVTDKHPDYFTFDVEDWFSKKENYALIKGSNVSFAEYKSPGIYWVHFCFDTAKGREAIQLTKDMFSKLCADRKVISVIGLIETRNKKAIWLIRQVGFKSLGEVDTPNGMCEMFYSNPSLQQTRN